MITIPGFILGLLTSTLYGALFHLWRGGRAGSLLLYILLSWAGFWIGHAFAAWQGWRFGQVGPLNLGMASLTSLIFLLVGHWLSLIEVETE